MEILLAFGVLYVIGLILVFVVGLGIWLFGLFTTIAVILLAPFIKLGSLLFIRILEVIEVFIALLQHVLLLASIRRFLKGYSKIQEQIEEDYLIETGQITDRSREL